MIGHITILSQKMKSPISKVSRRRCLISSLDEFASLRRDLKKYVGKISREDSDAVAKAVEEGRKVDADEWHGIGTDTGIPPLV